LSTAVGGENVSTVIAVRNAIPSTSATSAISAPTLTRSARVLIPVTGDTQVALSSLAKVRTLNGPAMIRNENGLLTGYVYVDIGDLAPGSYVGQARRHLDTQLHLPAGYSCNGAANTNPCSASTTAS